MMTKGDALAGPAGPVAAEAGAAPARLVSLDAYRGAVMFLMMAEVFQLGKLHEALPDSRFWSFLADAQSHREWRGTSLHDMIQPSFSFLVGAAMPFSLAARRRRGDSFGRSLLHAMWRALVLVLLGVALRSTHHDRTYWTFEDTLSQIGLGYVFLFLLGHLDRPVRWGAFAAIVVGYWAAFALHPVPGAGHDWQAVGVPPGWAHHERGFAAHWDKNANLAWRFDTWFLNLFPRESPFRFNRGGYATLSFIPTLATMLLGTIAADELRDGRTSIARSRSLVGIGLALLFLGLVAEWTGICPIVKRIWTPAWTLFSGGWCFVALAAFHAMLDGSAPTPRRIAYPLVAIGRNSIAAYVLAHLSEEFLPKQFRNHLGPVAREWLGAYEPAVIGAAVMAVYILVLAWMDRKRLYIKI